MTTRRDLQEICSAGDLTGIKTGGSGVQNTVKNGLSTYGDIKYEPQSSEPEYLEGKTYYDTELASLVLMGDVEGFKLPLGQRLVMRVTNSTGATLYQSQCVRVAGSVSGLPSVQTSIATTYEDAIVDGVLARDLPDGEVGYIITFGVAREADLTGYNVDDTLFLSDTIPGGITTVAPDLVTVIGQVADNTANGTALVNIQNHKAIPTTIGIMKGLDTIYTLPDTGAKTTLVGFLGSGGILTPVDPATGEITIPYSGTHRVSVSFSLTFTADGKDARNLHLELFNDDESVTESFQWPIAPDISAISGAFNPPEVFSSGDIIKFRMWNDGEDDIGGLQFQNIAIDIVSIHLRNTA